MRGDGKAFVQAEVVAFLLHESAGSDVVEHVQHP